MPPLIALAVLLCFSIGTTGCSDSSSSPTGTVTSPTSTGTSSSIPSSLGTLSNMPSSLGTVKSPGLTSSLTSPGLTSSIKSPSLTQTVRSPGLTSSYGTPSSVTSPSSSSQGSTSQQPDWGGYCPVDPQTGRVFDPATQQWSGGYSGTDGGTGTSTPETGGSASDFLNGYTGGDYSTPASDNTAQVDTDTQG